MQEVPELALPMDSTMAQSSNYMQLINDSTLAFLNSPTSEICVLSLKDQICNNKITIHQEGPDAVNGVNGFYIANPEENDSIWLYASWGQRVYRINSNGNLLESFVVPHTDTNSSGKYSVSPYPLTTSAYIVRNGLHYLQGMNGMLREGLDPGASLIFNAVTGKVTTGSPYPAVYGKKEEIGNIWDTFAYRQTSSYVTPQGEVITSFPASDSLYVWTPTTDVTLAYLADYSERPDIVPQMGVDRDELFKNYIKSFQYGAIFYDSENKLYYRLFHEAGEIDANDLAGSATRKPMGIIILDKNFEKVGECMLPLGEYYPVNAFVAAGILYVNILSDDDDFMKFKAFTVREL